MKQFSNVKEIPYWMEPLHVIKNYAGKDLPKETDVLIVGSGYTGVVTALQLKKAGVNVCLIDRGKLGSEASAKNGGMVLSVFTVDLYKVFKKYGQETLNRFFQELDPLLGGVDGLG